MNILQTISGFGTHSGGTSTCTYDLLTAMRQLGCEVDLATLYSPDLMGEGEPWIKALPNDSQTPFGYSANMREFLKRSDCDLYHTNGLWMDCNHATCTVARAKGKPCVITPHGMLYPVALRRSYWKKWLLIQLFFRKDIMEADCLHVTCRQEMEHVRAFGYRGPVAVIANPANLPTFLDEIAEEKPRFLQREPRSVKLGFLGRLHPRKKVENLLYALAQLPQSDETELVIMGKGDEDYERFLREEAQRLGLTNVSFLGFVQGRAKYEQLARLSCLFVPSDFENFGMIITEALSVGTPVTASLGTPWEVLNERRCGWWVDRSPKSLAQVMREVADMPVDELLAMGQRGQQLVKENFAAPEVAKQMIQLYQWLAGCGKKPDFVFIK